MVGMIACVRCKSTAPDMSGETTLVSKKGWRLNRALNKDGTLLLEWWCPPCWAERKAHGGSLPPKRL